MTNSVTKTYVAITPVLAPGFASKIARSANQAGEAAGKSMATGINKTVSRTATIQGAANGRKFADGFTKDANGRLRNSRGQFAKSGATVGKNTGDGVNEAFKKSTTGRTGILSTFGGLIKGMAAAYAGTKIVQFFGDSVRAASDMTETLSKSRNIFKDNSKVIEAWAKDAADKFGLSSQAAIAAASSLGDMFIQLGQSGKEATKTSQEVVKLAADLGSFHNLDTADVMDRITAAFRGEYDSLQALIPNINAARVEKEAMAATGKTVATELTAEEKAMATLAIVMKDGANAQNDFAETSDGLANKQKQLAAKVEDTKVKIGTALLPVITGLVTYISDKVVPAVQSFVDGFTGAEGAAGEWADAGAQAKAGLEDFKEAFSSLVEYYKENKEEVNALVGAITALMAIGKLQGVAAGLKGAFTPVGIVIATVGAAIYSVYSVLTEIKNSGVITGIADSVGAALNNVGGMFAPFKVAFLSGMNIIYNAWNYLKDHAPIWFGIVQNAVTTAFGNIGKAVKNVGTWFGNLWKNLDAAWVNMQAWLSRAGENFKTWLMNLGKNISGAADNFTQFFENIGKNLDAAWANMQAWLSRAGENFKIWLMNLGKNVSGTVDNITQWFQNLGTNIGRTWNNVKSGLGAGWQWIKDKVFYPIGRFVSETIPSKFRAMKDSVVGVWNGMKNAISKVWTGIVNTGRSAINGIGDFINKIIKAINKIPFVELKLLPSPLIGGGTGSGGVVKKARGGHVTGGPPGVDTVPAYGPKGQPYLLDNGEHILTRKEVNAMGGQDSVYAFRSALRSGKIKGYRNGGVPGEGNYRPGMGRDVGMVSSLVKLYKKFGGTGNLTSGYRPGDPLWHGSGLAADFGGYNQDAVASRLLSNRGGLLELIHSTRKRNYNVTRGSSVNMDAKTNREHQNHVHVASTPEALSMMLGGKFIPGAGQSGTLFDWLSSGAGKLAKGALNAAISGLKKILPTGKGAMPSALRGIGLSIPEKAKEFFESKAQTATLNPPIGRGGSKDVMKAALATARSMGASNKVLLALFEAGFVESNFRNLGHQGAANDHDSLGFLQQRPSQGWPNPTHVPTATRSFVRKAMQRERGYRTAGQLAQAVQVSAYPARYDQARGRAVGALKDLWPSYVAGNYRHGGAIYDNGGWLQPGQMGMNQGSRPEAVLTPEESAGLKNIGAGEMLDKLDRLIEAVERVAPGVGAEINDAARATRIASRRF